MVRFSVDVHTLTGIVAPSWVCTNITALEFLNGTNDSSRERDVMLTAIIASQGRLGYAVTARPEWCISTRTSTR